jgi:hypothetical protein
MIKDFRDVVDLCGSPAHLAAALGVEAEAVRKWRQRDRIPSEYWHGVLKVARRLGVRMSADDLTRLAARNCSGVGNVSVAGGRPVPSGA